MRLDAYDDMMGLEYGGDMLDGLLDPEMLKEALIASTAGGGAILLSTWGVKKLWEQLGLDSKIQNPLAKTAVLSGATFMLGLAAGRGVMKYNMNAGIGIVGGIGGVALANFLDAAISQMTGTPRMFSALGEGYPMGSDDGMAALAALETTSVESAPGAFGAFSDPTVTTEQLMGLEAAVVQQETLGGYQPYLA